MSRTRRLTSAFLGLTVIGSLAAGSEATAATVEVGEVFSRQSVVYTGDPGEKNDVSMSFTDTGQGWRIRVTDAGDLDTGDGCQARSDGAVCEGTRGRPRVDVDLGDDADRFDGLGLVDRDDRALNPVLVSGGDGPDVLDVTAGFTCPDGERGPDRIRLGRLVGSVAGRGICLVEGGTGADRIFGSPRRDYIDGESGDDLIRGRSGADELLGGDGGDELFGGDGSDQFEPGLGPDTAEGGAGNDRIDVLYPPPATEDGFDRLDGGPGRDKAAYRCGGCEIRLDNEANDGLPGEGDLLRVEDVNIIAREYIDESLTVYGPGDDVLEGNQRGQTLRTKQGDDKLTGGGGEDLLDSGDGKDEVYARDGERDVVRCGGNRDSAVVDRKDRVNDCEELTRRG